MRKALVLLLAAFLLVSCGGGGENPLPTRIAEDTDPAKIMLDPDPAPAVTLPDGLDVHVATFNIFAGRYASAQEIGAFLATEHLDIVGLEECPENMIADIAEASGLTYIAGEGTVLLSSLPVKTVETGTVLSLRTFVHAVIDLGGADLSVYVTHLDWNVEGDRQFRAFVDEQLTPDPVQRLVVLGDFNDEHYSTQVTIFEEVLTDAATEMQWYPGQQISWPSTGFEDTEGSQLIDLIFFRKDFKAIVKDLTVHDLFPPLSDHKPVTAWLRFPAAGADAFDSDPYAASRDIFKDFPPEGQRPQNLLANPGAEEGLTGWETWGDMAAVASRSNAVPRSGNSMFCGYEDEDITVGRISGARQDVDLRPFADQADQGLLYVYASGYMAIGYPTVCDGDLCSDHPIPYDDAEVVVELRDEAGGLLLRRVTGRRDTLAWHPFALAINAPPGARSARMVLLSHHKPHNDKANDGVFDDLYLGAVAGDFNGVLSPNLLGDAGAEAGESTGLTLEQVTVGEDLDLQGLTVFPPWSYSGAGYYYGGGMLEISGLEGVSSLTAEVDLSPYARVVAGGGTALSLAAALRTWSGVNAMTITLELYHADGEKWHTFDLGSVHAAQWGMHRFLAALPPGCGKARLRIETDVSEVNHSLFADELEAVLVRVNVPGE